MDHDREGRRHAALAADRDGAALREHQQLQADYARAMARAEQQEHQSRALFDLSRSVSVALELDELCQTVVEALYDALRADTASLFVRESDGRLRMVAQRNIDLTRARIIFGPDEGLIALAVRDGRTLHVPDTASSADYLVTGFDRPRSMLVIPVAPESGPGYALCIVRRRVYAFTDDEVQFATIMGRMAAHLLGNADLYQTMQDLASEQATLYEIARAASQSESATRLIGQVVEPLRRALRATGCAVVLIGSGEGARRARAVARQLSPHGLAQCHAFAAELAAGQAPGDVALRCDLSPDGSRLILAPVIVRDAPVAVIGWEAQVGVPGDPAGLVATVWSASQSLSEAAPLDDGVRLSPVSLPVPIAEGEARFVANASQQLALGIENLRLRARDLGALRSLSALPASRTHLDRLRQRIVHEIALAFAPAPAALILRDETTGAPRVVAQTGERDAAWTQAACTLAEQAGTAECVQRRGLALAALTTDHETLGWLALQLGHGARLTADRALLLTSLAGAAGLLLHNARLHLLANEAAVDRERQRIAREIHDGVAQNLAHLMLRLELIQRLIPADPQRAIGEATASRDVLFATLNDLRQSIGALAPAQLAELGFAGAVQALLDDIATNAPDLAVQFAACPDEAIPAELRAPAFRVVQEALNNVRKHARARHAWVTVERDAAHLRVTIRDDGRGFAADPNAPAAGHFGLRGMRERAAELGGTLAIAATPGAGTAVTLTLPLDLAA